MREYKIAETPQEIIHLFPLFHRFFDKVKVDYTEKEFFDRLPWIMQNGAIGYITEDGKPVAYGIIIKTEWFGLVGMILQVYSERPFLARMLQKMADGWCAENGIKKQVSLVTPEIAETLRKRYGMKKQFIFMFREVPIFEPEEEVEEEVTV